MREKLAPRAGSAESVRFTPNGFNTLMTANGNVELGARSELDLNLLVSTTSSIIMEVSRAHDARGNARLEVIGLIDKAFANLSRGGVGLLMIHLAPTMNRDHLNWLLQCGAVQAPMAMVFLCHDPFISAELRGVIESADVEVLCIPRDIDKLGRRIDAVQSAATPRSDAIVEAEPRRSLADDPKFPFLNSHGQSEQMRRVASQDSTILLSGESGTGKNVLARAIHDLSPRKGQPYLVVDCGVLAEHLIESEMFGHARGAFTGADRERIGKFAAAGSGTLVLDEINSLPQMVQCKLLRAVEDRVFEPIGSNDRQQCRARLIVVSNVPLDREWRAIPIDLYFRLNVVNSVCRRCTARVNRRGD